MLVAVLSRAGFFMILIQNFLFALASQILIEIVQLLESVFFWAALIHVICVVTNITF